MPKFKPGQTVYILGRYRAKVIECGQFTVTCDVYEGLPSHDKVPNAFVFRYLGLAHLRKLTLAQLEGS